VIRVRSYTDAITLPQSFAHCVQSWLCGERYPLRLKAISEDEKRLKGLPVFHRLRPPDETHRNQEISGAQIRRGETRQDLKIPTVSDGLLPRALSCSHHEVYPLQTAVRWRFLIPTHATEFLVGGSLQAGLYARTPRSTRLPRLYQVTVLLNPILKDTTKRHWR